MAKIVSPYKPPRFHGTMVGEAMEDIYTDTSEEFGKPSYEKNVLWALLQAGYRMDDIAYQVPMDGGRLSRNGLIIDFVLYIPSAIPIQVGASWWHRDSGEETLEDVRIKNYFGRYPVRIYDTDAESKEAALAAVIREIGHA